MTELTRGRRRIGSRHGGTACSADRDAIALTQGGRRQPDDAPCRRANRASMSPFPIRASGTQPCQKPPTACVEVTPNGPGWATICFLDPKATGPLCSVFRAIELPSVMESSLGTGEGALAQGALGLMSARWPAFSVR